MPINDPTRARNVIAFPRPGTGELTKVCIHCGGRLGEGESEDECSSAPTPAWRNASSLKWRKARNRLSNG